MIRTALVLLSTGAWFCGRAETDDFECFVCGKADKDLSCQADLEAEGAENPSQSCPSKSCYAFFGVIEKEGLWTMNEYRFVGLGCTGEHHSTVSSPVYAPVPLPEIEPIDSQFVCRRNPTGTPEDRFQSSMSCFCFSSKCQTHLGTAYVNMAFQSAVQESLPETGLWEYFDRTGRKLDPSEIVTLPTAPPATDVPTTEEPRALRTDRTTLTNVPIEHPTGSPPDASPSAYRARSGTASTKPIYFRTTALYLLLCAVNLSKSCLVFC